MRKTQRPVVSSLDCLLLWRITRSTAAKQGWEKTW